jgi:hypothetical protein
MYDGSFDDFIDGAFLYCIASIAKVNGSQVTFLVQLDYQQVISILVSNHQRQDSVVSISIACHK